jgi:hypothetical protein
MKGDLTFEKLGYLTTNELWKIMAELKIPYCTIVDDEKENLSTGEKVMVPRFIPRTDYEEMKSDIMVEYSKLNNSQRRFLCGLWNGIIEKRKKELKRNG